MTLGFLQTFANGAPTLFVQKIWKGLLLYDEPIGRDMILYDFENIYKKALAERGILISYPDHTDLHPKITTIRSDKADRWHKYNQIHPVINNRTKDRFQFAPTLTCGYLQKIEIKYTDEEADHDRWTPRVYIDDKLFFDSTANVVNYGGMKRLAYNDGFDSIDHFFSYFKEDFFGKIIHWTNLKYE